MEELIMQECRCGGLNPSCYLCHGLGFVKRRKVRPPKCPFCGKTKTGLTDHIRAKHSKEIEAEHRKVSITAPPLLEKELVSRNEVPYRPFLQKTRSTQARGPSRTRTGSKRITTPPGTVRSTGLDNSSWDDAEQFLICPICKAWFEPRVFKGHIRNRHPEAQKSEWFIKLNRKK